MNKYITNNSNLQVMDSLIPVNVVIGDRTYRIRIEPADEEVVRKTVKLINDKFLDYKTNFAGKDMQDYLAMVLLWYATQQKAAENQPLLDRNVKEQFDQLESMLDKALHP